MSPFKDIKNGLKAFWDCLNNWNEESSIYTLLNIVRKSSSPGTSAPRVLIMYMIELFNGQVVSITRVCLVSYYIINYAVSYSSLVWGSISFAALYYGRQKVQYCIWLSVRLTLHKAASSCFMHILMRNHILYSSSVPACCLFAYY